MTEEELEFLTDPTRLRTGSGLTLTKSTSG